MESSNKVIKKRNRKPLNAKKISIILLSLAVLFAALAVIIHFTTRVTNESYANCAVGDVNGDGKLDSSDSLCIFKYIVGNEDLFENQVKNADVNLDGRVDSVDALLLLRYSVGEISAIPYDEQKENVLNSSLKRKKTVTADSFTSTAQIVNEWDNNDGTHSYQVNLTVRNDSDTDSGDWKAAVSFDKEIVSLVKKWDCTASSDEKSVIVNGTDIAGGESYTCGFIITAESDLAVTKLIVR